MDKHNSILEIAGGVVAGDFIQAGISDLLSGLLNKSSWFSYSGLGDFLAGAVGGFAAWQGGKHIAGGAGEGIRLAAVGSSLRSMSTNLDKVLPDPARYPARWDYANMAETSKIMGNQIFVWGSLPR